MELAALNRIHDPFYGNKESPELFRWLEDEVREGKEELGKGDWSALESEMGDILWNVLNLLHKLEDEGKIDRRATLDKIIDKIERRKSFLLEKRSVTEEEAKEIWNAAKRREGYDESRLCWDIP